MSTDVLTESTTIWLPLVTGIITLILTLFGMWHGWLKRRQERRDCVTQLSNTAVRLTESSFVRPILKERIEVVIGNQSAFENNSPLWRMKLFCELRRTVCLTKAEKTEARVRAFNSLVDQIRGHIPPPLKLKTDEDLTKNTPLLYAEIENAFNLNPQPANRMIMDLGTFAILGTTI